MDNIDKIIIKELKKNSKITMKELGEIVHLSGQATSTRVLKLEDSGIIEGYTININNRLYGYPVHAIIHIYTRGLSHGPYINFINSQEDFVIHNYKISGDNCYLLECQFPSTDIMDEFLVQLNQYVNYKINLVLKDVKNKGI